MVNEPLVSTFLRETNLPKGFRHRHNKRQAVVTEADVVTVQADEVVVYVDGNGDPVSTRTILGNQATPTSVPSLPLSSPTFSSTSPVDSSSTFLPLSSSTPAQALPSSTPLSTTLTTSTTQAPAPSTNIPASSTPLTTLAASSPTSTAAPAASSSPASPQGPGFKSAITYSPYNPDNSCKSASQVAQDLAQIDKYEVIRLYGVDCNQIANVLVATKGKNVQIFAGIFSLTDIPDQVKTIVSSVNGDWSVVNTVSVGNELVNSGAASAGDVIAGIGQAKSLLKAAGYNGPVVTIDTENAMANNIDLCKASDYCAINCHAFFDPNTAASGAGAFVLGWVEKISSMAGGKTTVVTETGWPHQGSHNNMAIPSPDDQKTAIASLNSAFSNNMILFSAYNTPWKKDNSGTFGAERYWGIYGTAPSEQNLG